MALRWIAFAALVAGGMSTAQAEEGDFFPLEVGNRWVFQKYDLRYPDNLRLEGTVSTEVIGQVQLQERQYFVVRQDWNWILPDTLYLRKEGAQVFRYIEQPDTVAAGLSAQERDSWYPNRGDPIPLDPNQTDWLTYDFEAPQGTFWDLPLQETPWTDVIIWWVFVNARWEGDTGPINSGCCWRLPFQLTPSHRFFLFFATVYSMEWVEVFEVGVGPVYITHFTSEAEIWDFGLLKEAHIGGQTIIRDPATSVEQTSWGQVKMSPGDRSIPANRAYRGR